MNTAVRNLQEWFDELSADNQQAVIDFLYGRLVVSRGSYYGPNPQIVTKGLSLGPKPATFQATQVCPTCGRPT